MGETQPISPGTWLPSADALCEDCCRRITHAHAHARWCNLGLEFVAKGRCTTPPGEDRIGCGKPIWLPYHVAPLTRIKPEFPGSFLEQTGGMCSALVIRSDRQSYGQIVGPVAVVTYLDGFPVVGVYLSFEDWWNAVDAGLTWEATEGTTDELVRDTIRRMLRGGLGRAHA